MGKGIKVKTVKAPSHKNSRVSDRDFNSYNSLIGLHDQLSTLNRSLKTQSDPDKLKSIEKMNQLILDIKALNIVKKGFSSSVKTKIDEALLYVAQREAAISKLALEIALSQAAAIEVIEPAVKTAPVASTPEVAAPVAKAQSGVVVEDVDSENEELEPVNNASSFLSSASPHFLVHVNESAPNTEPAVQPQRVKKTVTFDDSPLSAVDLMRTLSSRQVNSSPLAKEFAGFVNIEENARRAKSPTSSQSPTSISNAQSNINNGSTLKVELSSQILNTPVVSALMKEARRLEALSHNTGITGLFWNATYQAKYMNVMAALLEFGDISDETVTVAIKDNNSALYKALNTHTSTLFQFSSDSYGLPCSWKTRSVLNIEKVINDVEKQAVAAKENEPLIVTDTDIKPIRL